MRRTLFRYRPFNTKKLNDYSYIGGKLTLRNGSLKLLRD